MNISIFKEVIFNKDLMGKIQTFKPGITSMSKEAIKVIIKHCNINAYIELLKDVKLDGSEIELCIQNNRHDILDIVKPLETERYFRCAFNTQNIDMIERFKRGALSGYILNINYNLETLRYILENDILPEYQMVYNDGTGIYKINIDTLAHITGDISFMDWYCEKIDLDDLVEYKNYDALMYFIDDERAIKKKQAFERLQREINNKEAVSRLKRLINDIDGDNN